MEVPRAFEQVGEPALRDAEEIVRRIRQDESEADEARIRYRVEGRPSETAVDVRSSTVVTRHPRGDGTDELAGPLLLTTQRLLVMGHTPLEVELDEIDELTFAGERLLVTLRDGTGLSLDVAKPRLLRVQIAALREAAGT